MSDNVLGGFVDYTPEPNTGRPEESDRWHTGEHFHRMPGKAELEENPLDALLFGWTPATPLINDSTRVLAFGSCFASYFIAWLADHGFNKNVQRDPRNMLVTYGSTFESAAVVEQQFRWAFEEFDPRNALWIDHDKKRVEAAEEQRLLVRRSLEEAEVLILTLGLSEVWYDRVTNEPLWRTLPLNEYDPMRHEFRVLAVHDTVRYLESIARIRQTYLPDLKILYSVSPKPLLATFRPISALTANSISKATLRAGLDEFFRTHQPEMNSTYFYFPSYELIMDVFRRPFQSDYRHLYEAVIQQTMEVFAWAYTTLPIGGRPTLRYVDVNELLADQLSEMERSAKELSQACEQKEAMIRQLSLAADERLRALEELDAACRARDQRILELERVSHT